MSHQEIAAQRGHTLSIIADCAQYTLEGWCDPKAEFEGVFQMTCADTGELLGVHGYQFDVEAV